MLIQNREDRRNVKNGEYDRIDGKARLQKE